MGKAKFLKLVLDGNGSYLGMEKGCFVVKDKSGIVKRYPLFENEIGEVVLKSGNFVSTGALAGLGFWGVNVVVLTRNGNPVAVLKALDDDSHVKTRIAQYEALRNGKGLEIAKTIVLSKIVGQNEVLRKYGLEQHDLTWVREKLENVDGESLASVRYRLMHVEGIASKRYFSQIFKLFPEPLRVGKRFSWRAYDGVNNTFNLAYTLLKYKVYSAVLKAHLEAFLGFLHSEQWGKPSLVCDFMELYRYLVEDLIIDFSRNLSEKDFVFKKEWFSSNRYGKRQVLSKRKTEELIERLNQLWERKVKIPRIRHGKSQTVETLIYEEAYLLAKYLRNERQEWKPRIACVTVTV